MLFRRCIPSQLFCLAIMLLPVIAHAQTEADATNLIVPREMTR